MTELELVNEILDFIKIQYKANYIGVIKVTKADGIYTLSIGIPNYKFPTLLSGNFENDEDFLEYIKKELSSRNYMRVYFYEVRRESL
jgi:hypothetical protein